GQTPSAGRRLWRLRKGSDPDFYVVDPDSRAVAERPSVRADAVPARRGPYARVRDHGHDQPRARLALHAGRLPRLDVRAAHRVVPRRRAARDPGYRGARD